jgi:hypothetical protein
MLRLRVLGRAAFKSSGGGKHDSSGTWRSNNAAPERRTATAPAAYPDLHRHGDHPSPS